MTDNSETDPYRTRTDMSAQQMRIIDKLATAFDQAWKKGDQPQIEAYLTESPATLRAELFQSLLRIELSILAKQGKSVPASTYLARFPQFASEIHAICDETVKPSRNSTSVQPETWYYLRNNVRVGPFTFDQLKQIVRAGDLRPKDRVAAGPTADWGEAGSIPDLFPRPGESGGLKAPAPGDGIKGDYVLLERVGRGGMGDVFKAYRFSLCQEVALKIVRHDRFVKLSPHKQNEILESFRKEMQVAASLKHDHIISIFDNGDHNGLPFYTMNFVEKSLANILHHGPLNGQKAAEYIHKVAQAVDFANDKGVVHRDIKPANILLDKQRALLTDLGLATTENLLEGQGGQVAGTPPFMAPEQVRGDKLDKRSDVYGLGATLYCLLTGKPPHQGKDWEQIRDQVLNAEPVPPRKLNPAVDRNLEAVTLKCLEKDPDKRYESAGALAEDLDRYLNDRPVLAKRPYFWERLYKWARREPLKAGLVAGIIFLLMSFFGCETINTIRLTISLENVRAERTVAQNEREIAQQERDRAQKKEVEANRSADEARQAKEKLALAQKKHQEIATMFAMRAFNKFKQHESTDKGIEDLTKYIALARKNEQTDPIKLDLAESHRNLAQLYLQKGMPKEAAQQYKECTDLQEELSMKREYQIILLELALNLMELGTIYGQLLQVDPELNADLKALECLNKFEAEGKTNPVYLTALAEVNTMLGIDYRKGGRRADSLAHQRKAIEILEELNRQEKGNLTFGSFQKQLGKAYLEIGSTFSNKDAVEALTYLEKSKAIFTLRKTQYRRELVGVDKSLGTVLLALNRHEDAFAPLQEANELVNQLLDESPDTKLLAQLRLLKAQIISVEAMANQRKGDTDKAKELFKESVNIREDLVARDPKGFDPGLVDGLIEAAIFLVTEKDYLEARRYLDKAIPIQDRLMTRYPDVPNYTSTMGLIWFQKGVVSDRQENDQEALTNFLKAKDYDIQAYNLTKKTGDDFVGYLEGTYRNLFTIQMNLKLYKEAAATIEERVKYLPNNGNTYRAAALDFAKVYNRDKTDEMAARLVTFLDKGLQQKLLRFDDISSDPTFENIRAQPEFLKLKSKYQP